MDSFYGVVIIIKMLLNHYLDDIVCKFTLSIVPGPLAVVAKRFYFVVETGILKKLEEFGGKLSWSFDEQNPTFYLPLTKPATKLNVRNVILLQFPIN